MANIDPNDIFSDICHDHIFPSFIYSAKVSEDICTPQEITQDIIKLKMMEGEEGGLVASNRGGWHSKRYSEHKATPFLDDLGRVAKGLADQFCRNYGYKTYARSHFWWANVNSLGSYNNIHTHGATDIIGIYYSQLPNNSGSMCLVRKDGSEFSNLYTSSERTDEITYKLDAVPGRVYIMPGHLWHYVEVNESKVDRYSVAFNIVCN